MKRKDFWKGFGVALALVCGAESGMEAHLPRNSMASPSL